LLGAVGVVVHVPRLPLFNAGTLWPDVQSAAEVCVGFGCAVVGNGVYTYVQDHCEVVTVPVVPPVTVDAKVCTVPAITVAVVGDTVSMIVFGLELPHPFCQSIVPASPNIAANFIVRHFMNDISLVNSARSTARVHFLKNLFPL
jgi:hypothetical protein